MLFLLGFTLEHTKYFPHFRTVCSLVRSFLSPICRKLDTAEIGDSNSNTRFNYRYRSCLWRTCWHDEHGQKGTGHALGHEARPPASSIRRPSHTLLPIRGRRVLTTPMCNPCAMRLSPGQPTRLPVTCGAPRQCMGHPGHNGGLL